MNMKELKEQMNYMDTSDDFIELEAMILGGDLEW